LGTEHFLKNTATRQFAANIQLTTLPVRLIRCPRPVCFGEPDKGKRRPGLPGQPDADKLKPYPCPNGAPGTGAVAVGVPALDPQLRPTPHADGRTRADTGHGG